MLFSTFTCTYTFLAIKLLIGGEHEIYHRDYSAAQA
jgi:hypothetical protein